MATVDSSLGGGKTPICSECGIALCFDIDDQEYEEMQDYWDAWRCEVCDPDVKGTWLKARMQREITRRGHPVHRVPGG